MISKMLSLLVLVLILGCSGAQSAIAETQDISNLETIALSTLHFPREVCTPQVHHTSVIQDYALVEWQCGDAGGEMLLRKEQNAWQCTFEKVHCFCWGQEKCCLQCRKTT